MTSITVDVDIEDFLDEASDRALIAEVNERMTKASFVSLFSERIKNAPPISDGTQSTLNRLAEEIACGDTANALDTLRSIFPSLSTHNAIGFAHRTMQVRNAA